MPHFQDDLFIDKYWITQESQEGGAFATLDLRKVFILSFVLHCIYFNNQPIKGVNLKYHIDKDELWPYVGINYEAIANAFPVFQLSQKLSIKTDIDELVKSGFLVEPTPRPKGNLRYIQVSKPHLQKLESIKKIIDFKYKSMAIKNFLSSQGDDTNLSP